MNAFGVIAIIVLILLGMFFLSSKESQDKVIEKSPDFFKPILEMIKGINNKSEVNNNYIEVGKPTLQTDCKSETECNTYFSECLENCTCSNGSCYKVGG